jgi:MSHA pilin protein MshD
MRTATRRQRGLTLVELVMFIVLMGIAFGALVLALNQFVKGSADPLIRKQALAIAESLLEEVELMPFTFCDPDDTNASTATSSSIGGAGCATLSEDLSGTPAIGPEAGESRYSSTTPFDNVSDYNTFQMLAGAGAAPSGGIRDISGTQVANLLNYAAQVSVAQSGMGSIPATESLRITVTVTAPDGSTLALDGFRTRYSPRTSQ